MQAVLVSVLLGVSEEQLVFGVVWLGRGEEQIRSTKGHCCGGAGC